MRAICGAYIVSTSSLNLDSCSISFEYMFNRYMSKSILIYDMFNIEEVELDNKFYYFWTTRGIELYLKDYTNDSIANVGNLIEEYIYETKGESYDDTTGFDNSIFERENEIKLNDLMSVNFWRNVSNIVLTESLDIHDLDRHG